MCVHLRAAILEQAADILKSGACRLRIMRRNSTRGCKQVRSDSIRVGMKDKRSKNIAEDHSTEDEADSTDHKDSSRAAAVQIAPQFAPQQPPEPIAPS